MTNSAPESSSRLPRLAYLFSRYPIISQTFCDNEILGLEEAGWKIVVASLNLPQSDIRHRRLDALRAPVLYQPPPSVLKILQQRRRASGTWPQSLIEQHEERYGEASKPDLRCRNAIYLAEELPQLGIDHVHLHFANHATHTALFLKELSGIPFSFTPQAQDFLVDMNPDLLAELCREAEFVVAPCDYAKDKLTELCPDSASNIIRVYNGIDPAGYRQAAPKPQSETLKIASCGRLIEFKGFHHLLAAMAIARESGVRIELDLMGDGPWRERLEAQTDELGLRDQVQFHGTVGLDQMKAVFEEIDAFVLACIFSADGASDMFPTVVTEAMLSGLPVISSRVAGVPELVIHGETGFLTDPGDEAALAKALVQLATEPGLAANLGKSGRKCACEVFSRTTTLAQLQERFRGLPISPQPSLRPPTIIGFYDLSTTPLERFQLEHEVLEQLGGNALLAARNTSQTDLETIEPLDRLLWLPDGMVLEMEWQACQSQHEQLIQLRDELGSTIDGETFFLAARRAIWWATAIQRRGGASLLYAPSASECLTVWITSSLSGIPFTAAIERESDFPKSLRQRILNDAQAVAIQAKDDPLLRGVRRPKPELQKQALEAFLRKLR